MIGQAELDARRSAQWVLSGGETPECGAVVHELTSAGGDVQAGREFIVRRARAQQQPPIARGLWLAIQQDIDHWPKCSRLGLIDGTFVENRGLGRWRAG